MTYYRLSGENISLPEKIAGLEFFSDGDVQDEALSQPEFVPLQNFIAGTKYEMSGKEREIEAWYVRTGMVIRISDGSDFHIASSKASGIQINKKAERSQSSQHLTKIDREALLGPVLILSIATKNIWSLHASAAMFNENVIVFLGESGMGKSTLAAYLSKQTDWQRVADDILPVKYENGLQALPHFPQLKLPAEQQPAIGLPEHLPLNTLCLLEHAEADAAPAIAKMNTAQTVQALLSHTAGTRMFSADMLTKHLQFSTQAAAQVAAYKLTYPHRREALPMIKELLEQTC